MRVLVTGASGLLGRTVATSLISRGDDVTVFQRRPSGLSCREVLGDITDSDAVALAAAGMDAIVHLAARVNATGSWEQFESVNVGGTVNVIDAARRGGVRHLVHVSSPSVAHGGSSLVGAGAGRPRPEEVRGHYARSKAMGELRALAGDDGSLRVVVVRPHLVWGPGDTQLVGRIVERARSGRLALVGSGTALIDTTYIDNAATALVAALDRAEEVHGSSFVISNGEPRTVEELLTRICLAAGVQVPRRRVPVGVARAGGAVLERVWALLGRDDDPPMTAFLAEQLATAHWFDQRATRAALGWSPHVSLDEGFERLASWFASDGGPAPVS